MRRNDSKKIAAAAIAGAAVLAAAACSSPRTASNSNASKYNTMSVSQLASAAKKEGKFIDYDSAPAATDGGFLAAFDKAYPGVTASAVRLESASIPTRIFVEQRARKYIGDTAGADGVYMTELRLGGATIPYTPPTQPVLPKGLSLPKGYQTVDSVETTVAAYNPTLLRQHHVAPPTSWQDFTKPQWKGHFSVDPEAVNWYTGLISEYGHTKALALVKAIGNNDPIPVQSHSQALVQLESGQTWATATSYGYLAALYSKKDPAHVAFSNFKPLITSADMTYILKDAPHPAAARLYVNWELSKAGQQAMVNIIGLNSLRPDVKQDPKVWNPSKFPPIFPNPNLTTKQLAQYQQEFQSALHVSS